MNTETKKWWQRLWIKIILILLGFGLIALLASMQMSGQSCLFEHKEIRARQFLPINLIYFFCWGLLFPIIQKLCHFISNRIKKWPMIVFLHIGLGTLISMVHLGMLYILIPLGMNMNLITIEGHYDLPTLAYRWLGSNIYIYIALAGFLHFFYFYRQNRERELKTSQLETQMARIQLQSLKTQLHPHFLFNSLNTISAYVKKNPDTAIKMTARLSDLLRLTLETKTQLEIPLEEELKIVNNYLEIEKLRFADRLEVTLDIAPDVVGAHVPAVLLQPLAENAVRHGISHNIDKGAIKISAHKKDGKLELRVEDDGPGMKENIEVEMSKGIGLKNIRERLNKLYGDESEIIIDNKEKGFFVKITIPFKLSPPLQGPP